MNSNNSAACRDVIVNSVDPHIFILVNSAVSTGQLETLLNSELGHNLIAWPRQYLETYLDSDATGRVPLAAEQLQDILGATFDRDAGLAREYLEELNDKRGLMSLGHSRLQITIARRKGIEPGYQLVFDPADTEDLRNLIERFGHTRPWETIGSIHSRSRNGAPYGTTRESYLCSCASTPKRRCRASRQNDGHRRAQTAWRRGIARRPPIGTQTDGRRCTS
jgi:hypothetical protein